MARKFLTAIDLAKNELQNTKVQNLASAPSSPANGQIYYDTTLDQLGCYHNGSWVYLAPAGGGGNVTQSANSGASGRVKVSAGADKTIADYTGGAGILKTSDANGTLATATAGTDYVTGNSTNTFTNKTIDANGTGNSITNLDTADFAANVIDNDSTLAANSATRLATQQAVKGYVDNAVQGLAWKQPVRAATTGNGALATAYENGDTIDGVVLSTGDRILLKDQTTQTENGIYIVNATGAPSRASDANTAGELVNATVFVSEGTANADKVYTCTNQSITIGTTNLEFVEVNGGTVPVASTTVQGKVELADATETEAKTDGTRAVTPLGLANFPIKKTFTIGDGSATTINCTHNLGTKDVIVQIRQASDDAIVEADIVNSSTTVTAITFATAPTSNAIKVVIIG